MPQAKCVHYILNERGTLVSFLCRRILLHVFLAKLIIFLMNVYLWEFAFFLDMHSNDWTSFDTSVCYTDRGIWYKYYYHYHCHSYFYCYCAVTVVTIITIITICCLCFDSSWWIYIPVIKFTHKRIFHKMLHSLSFFSCC